MINNAYVGSCLCQKVTYSVTGFSNHVAHCYCSMCRKFHGAAYGTLVAVEGLKWLTGFEFLKHFQAPNGTNRTFCAHCGSSIGFRGKEASINEIELAVATFDEDIPLKVDAQIYTENRANWSELDTHLPIFKENRIKE